MILSMVVPSPHAPHGRMCRKETHCDTCSLSHTRKEGPVDAEAFPRTHLVASPENGMGMARRPRLEAQRRRWIRVHETQPQELGQLGPVTIGRGDATGRPMLSLQAEQRQERLRSLTEAWVCGQGQVFSSGPGPLSLAEPEPVRDPDGVPPVDGGSFLGPLQSGHSAVDAAVGTLSFLAWRIETVCKKVRKILPALLAMGIVPPGPEGGEESAGRRAPTTESAGDGTRDGPTGATGSSSQNGGRATTAAPPESSAEAEAHQKGAIAPDLGSPAQEEDPGDGAQEAQRGTSEANGEATPPTAEASQQRGDSLPAESLQNTGPPPSAEASRTESSGVQEQANGLAHGAASVAWEGGAHLETAAMLPHLRSLAALLDELSVLVHNTLLQMHCLYPPPPAPQGTWGPLWRTASAKPPGPRVPPLFLKFPGRVHLPSVTASLAEALSTVLTVDEALRFNAAVSHGLSSYQQLLLSAAQVLQQDPSAVPGATWASVQGLLHGVGQLANQLLPSRGIFARLCTELKARGVATAAAGQSDTGAQGGGTFPNASALVEVLSVAGPSLSQLLRRIPDAPTPGAPTPAAPEFGSEGPQTRPLIAGHVGLICLLCSQLTPSERGPLSQGASTGPLTGALAPKKLAQLLLSGWEAAEKFPLLHLWGPVAMSPLELLVSHVPPAVYPHAPRPLAVLALPGSWRGVLLRHRRAALQGATTLLAHRAAACCARLAAMSTQLLFPAPREDVVEAAGERVRVLLEGIELSQWAAREVQLVLDLHSVLQTPLPATRMPPLLALLLAVQSFATVARGCQGEVRVAQPLVLERTAEPLRVLLGAMRAGVEQAQAKEASGAYGAFFGALVGAGSASTGKREPHSQGLQSESLGGAAGGRNGDPDASSTAASGSEFGDGRPASSPPAPLALLAVCERALGAPATLPPPARHALAVAIHICLGIASSSDQTKKDVLSALQALVGVAGLEAQMEQAGASLDYLLWQQQQLLPALLRTLWGHLTATLPSAEGWGGLTHPAAPLPGMSLQLLLDCFVGALKALGSLPLRSLAAGAVARFEADLREQVEAAVVAPLVKDLEADVRLHVHSVRLGQASVGVNPRRTGLRDLTRLLALPPLRLGSQSLSLAGAAEEHLTRTLFNQALVSPLGAQRAYREMQGLAAAKYGLRLVPRPLLLPPAAPAGVPPAAPAGVPPSTRGQEGGPRAQPAGAAGSMFGSLAWVLSNLDSFAAGFSYNAARHVFWETEGGGRAKVREVRGEGWVQELQQPLAGGPLLARAEEASVRVGASCLQQLLHTLTHDTVQTLLAKEAQHWASAEARPPRGGKGQRVLGSGDPSERDVGAPYPLARAEAVVAGLAKVGIRRDALGGRGGGGRAGAPDGQTAPILEVCAALVSRLGLLSALLQTLSTAAFAGTDGSQGRGQESWRPHLSAVLGHLRRTVQDTPCSLFFLLLPCLTLHHVRSQARAGPQARGSLSGGSARGSGAPVLGSGSGPRGAYAADEFGVGLALVVAACQQEVRVRHLRWFSGVRGTLAAQLSSAEAELRTCQPPPEHHLWGQPVEVLNPERALHLQGVIQETSQMLGFFARLEATIARSSSIMEA